MEFGVVQAVCDQCFRLHCVRELVQIDGELHQSCPVCLSALAPLPQPLTAELQRLFQIEGAAKRWLVAHRAEEAARAGNVFRRERLLPPGRPGIALAELAELLADA
jgi:hypothetical protein